MEVKMNVRGVGIQKKKKTSSTPLGSIYPHIILNLFSIIFLSFIALEKMQYSSEEGASLSVCNLLNILFYIHCIAYFIFSTSQSIMFILNLSF